MTFLKKLDLGQRYNLVVFIAIGFISLLLVVSIDSAISKYALDYSNKYWANYTRTFSDSALATLLLDSGEGGAVITHNLHSDKNIIKATIYTVGHKVFASSGQADSCPWPKAGFDKPMLAETPDTWCFSSPINHQGSLVGNVELLVSKADYQSVVHNLLNACIAIVLGFSLLMFFMVSYLSRHFTSTIVEMVKILRLVGQGGRSQRIDIAGAADIEMMRDVFNDMLTKVELNEHLLEQAVFDRTQELKMALDASESANVYKSQIMALVSHEMKTPVHNAMGLMQIVKDEMAKIPGFDLMNDYQARALSNTNELKNMIENILLQGRLESNRFELTHSLVEVKAMLVECCDNVGSLWAQNKNKRVMSGNENVIASDPVALRLIINNLMSNAWKFTQEGVIHIQWWLDQNALVLQVADTGCGIAHENLQYIFDSFWQEPQKDPKLGRQYEGHGLGLAITRQLVERLDGHISVKPNPIKGTVFTVTIPSLEGRFGHHLKGGKEAST